MKKYLFIVLLVGVCFGQTIAITSEGKIINLNDDGTWSYQEEKVKSDTFSESIWATKYFVDDFGDPTNKPYFSTFVNGVFSNSATTNSKLGVSFIITDEVAIKLFEYSRNHSVSGKISTKKYQILLKHNGMRSRDLNAENSSDRLVLTQLSSERLIKILKSGGSLGFKIIESGKNSSSTYNFEIPDASGFSELWNNYYDGIEKKKEELKKRKEEKKKKYEENLSKYNFVEIFSSEHFKISVKQLIIDGGMSLVAELDNLTSEKYKSVKFDLNGVFIDKNKTFFERVTFFRVDAKGKKISEIYTGGKLKNIEFKFDKARK